MLDFVESLLGGPADAMRSGRTGWSLVWALPLLAASVGMGAAGVAGLVHLVPGAGAALLGDVSFAVGSALACIAIALPAVACGKVLPWLVPLWIGPMVGAAGWALLPLPPGPGTRLAETTGLLLPVMVVYLGAGWQRLPGGLVLAATACGASPLRACLIGMLRPALPILLRGLGLVFVLGLGVGPLLPGTPVLAPLAGTP